MDTIETKTCSKCKVEKPATNKHFANARNTSDGLQCQCKECKKLDHLANREKRVKQSKERYRRLHPLAPQEILPEGYKRCCVCKEAKPYGAFGKLSSASDGLKYECKECRKVSYLENQQKNIEKSKKYYDENKEDIAVKNRIYKETNAEYYRSYFKQYYIDNKEQLKENIMANHYKRMEEDIGYRVLTRCRTRLYQAVKGHVKSKRTIELIGCPVESLLEHLERQFTRGMSWDNYGEWHIDHIKPCASYDFSKEEHQRECFHYSNLQPLWAKDNHRKAARY